MKKIIRPTVTVGIPAYNEEANIKSLLEMILSQKGDFKLEKLIVASDGSDDSTINIVNKMIGNKPFAFVMDGNLRRGKTVRLKEIINNSDTDVLITLDADIVIKDKYFIEKIISPITDRKVDLVSNKLVPLAPRGFIEKTLYVSVSFKNDIESLVDAGDNLYSCHGTSRAFSKKLYKNYNPPNIVSEDAFSYLYSKNEGYKYTYLDNLITFFRLPDNFIDHTKQSLRFFIGQKELKKHFPKDFVEKCHEIPKSLMMSIGLKYLKKYPLEVLFYLFLVNFLRIRSSFSPRQTVVWQIAKSTRNTKVFP